MFDKEAMLQEMEILKGASHPNVLQVFELFEDETHFYIVTEYFEGQNLLDRANKQMIFQEHDINHIMKEILQAINYCHTIGISHRDIKPENVLINYNNNIKIIDFGLALHVRDNNLTGQAGT